MLVWTDKDVIELIAKQKRYIEQGDRCGWSSKRARKNALKTLELLETSLKEREEKK